MKLKSGLEEAVAKTSSMQVLCCSCGLEHGWGGSVSMNWSTWSGQHVMPHHAMPSHHATP